jgi:microcystin degradation protein MlrC
MRIVVAQMSHETNTFSPVVTDLARFAPIAGRGSRYIPRHGIVPRRLHHRLRSCGRDDRVADCGRRGAEWSGRSAAFEYIADKITKAIAEGCDAIMLDLRRDGDADLRRRGR